MKRSAKSTTFVLPQTLTPTSAAAKYHSFHVYSKYKSVKMMPVKCSQLHGGGKTMMEN